MKRQRLTRMAAVAIATASVAGFAAGDDYVTYRETWAAGTVAGWHSTGRPTVETSTLGLDGSSVALRFPSQFIPFPESGSFVADAAASGGFFVGNYTASNKVPYAIDFDLMTDGTMPSAVWFVLTGLSEGGTNTFQISVGDAVQAPGVWAEINVPLSFSAGNWISAGTGQDFTNALSDVQSVEVRIARSGVAEQVFAMDRFTLTSILPPGAMEQDADSDGLPDYWEVSHFGGATNAVALIDSDGDGYSNGAEFIAGTDPNDRSSFLRIRNIAGNSDIYEIWFDTYKGRQYLFGRVDDLVDGTWPWDASTQDGDGGYMYFLDTNAVDRTFYRIKVQLP